MNKFIIGLAFLVVLSSCTKEKITDPATAKDYSIFLTQTAQTFQGKFNGSAFYWFFGYSQFQSTAGFYNGNGVCDSTDPERILVFGLTSEDDLETRFLISTPKYNSSVDQELEKIFTPGKKKLGNLYTDFHLTVTKDKKDYKTSATDTNNEIEVLKTEPFTDYLGKKLRVWFRLSGKLSSCNCQNSTINLTDGVILAEFFGYKKTI